MDLPPEELQHLGPVSILRQAIAVGRSSPKHFGAITLVLVFPLSFAILAHSLITHPLFIHLHSYHGRGSSSSALAALLVFQSLYLLFLFSFSLLSTGAVVYSAACIYTSKSLSFSALLSSIPRLLKPLFHTFLWIFFIMFLYYAAFVLALLLVLIFASGTDDEDGPSDSFGLFLVLLLLGLIFGFLHIYISAIWHLASVVSVLEDAYGLAAMKKSKELLRGKMGLAGILVFAYLVACGMIGGVFGKVVVRGGEHYLFLVKFVVGFVLVVLLVAVNLVGLLVQSVFYYVCKAYHHQGIDKSALYDHLGGYLGEYVPLKSSIQMEALEM